MRKPNQSYTNFTSYRLKQAVAQSGKTPYQTGVYTHIAGDEAWVMTYDYKKKDAAYAALSYDAWAMTLIAEKQAKYQKVPATVPRVMTIIDKSNRLITIRSYISGVVLSKENQGTKSHVYVECVNELERITKSLSEEEAKKIVRVTEGDMNKRFPRYVLHALVTRPESIKHLAKLAYAFYRNAPGKTVLRAQLAHRALTSSNIIVAPEQIYMTNFRTMVLTSAGTDIALFPQLYYREIGSETMRSYLEEQINTPEKKRRFMHLSAFYALQLNDETYIRVLTESIAPYAARVGAGHDARRRTLSLVIEPKNV